MFTERNAVEAMPPASLGAAAGLLLTSPLVALWYAGSAVSSLPFVPFDIFDALARVLPGSVLTFGIDLLVTVIGALRLGPTAGTAKLAEQTMAVTLVLIVGTASAAIVFAAAQRILRGSSSARILALTAGVILAAGAWLATIRLARGSVFSSGAWILLTMVIWSLALDWTHQHLRAAPSMRSDDAFRNRLAADRRRFLLRVGGAMAATTIAGATVGARARSRREREFSGRKSSGHGVPNANDSIVPVEGTRPELTPVDDHYRIDIDTLPPHIRESDWQLRVSGLVDRPVAWSLEDIRARAALDQFITLSCISNPVGGDLIGTTRWTGISLKPLLDEWAVRRDATHLRIRSVDGFYEVLALDVIRRDERVMLVHAWDGAPLQVKHGFPLRVYIPNVYGMKQPKWIQSIEAVDQWSPGYWVERGWDRDAVMKATSVIDTIRVGPPTADGLRAVSAGGIAHAGARGISRVEVQVDDGGWQNAELRAPLSPLTWVVWRADLRMTPGRHVLTVRCTDGHGAPQLTTIAPPHPSGASGLHQKTISF